MTEAQIARGVRWIRILKIFTLLCAAGMLFFAVILNIGHLNGDDLKRLAARIDFGISGSLPQAENIAFTDGESELVVPYKDGVAVVADDRLKVFDATGIEFYNTQLVMNSPSIKTADKYILVFDRGYTQLGVYNSFSQVGSLTFEMPIINADINDAGCMVVVHKVEGYKSQLTLYGTGFRERYKWYSASTYILDAAVYGNCVKFACAGITLDESGANCEVMIFSPDIDEPTARVKIDGSFVYDMVFVDKHKIAVATDSGWTVIDCDSGEIMYNGTYPAGELLQFDVAYGRLAYTVSRRQAAENVLTVVDCKTGEEVNVNLPYMSDSLALMPNAVAVISADTLLCYDGADEIYSEQLSRDEDNVLAAGNSRLIIFTNREARFVSIR